MKIIYIIMAVLVAISAYVGIRCMQYNYTAAWWNNNLNKCSDTIPTSFKILYNSNNDKYAVTVIVNNEPRYLWARMGWIDWSYDPYTTFGDSCKAKSFIFQYIREKQADDKKYKGYK